MPCVPSGTGNPESRDLDGKAHCGNILPEASSKRVSPCQCSRIYNSSSYDDHGSCGLRKIQELTFACHWCPSPNIRPQSLTGGPDTLKHEACKLLPALVARDLSLQIGCCSEAHKTLMFLEELGRPVVPFCPLWWSRFPMKASQKQSGVPFSE